MTDKDELIDVHLRLTKQELDYLTAAACDFFHKMRAGLETGLMPTERFYIARDMWFKLEEHSKLSDWGDYEREDFEQGDR